MFERLIVHLDEPFADVSLFPTFSVSELAREHVKVVLSGDGGDELFGGYDAYQAQALAAKLRLDGRRADAGARRRGGGAAADREEEGPRQQGQALQRRRRARRPPTSVTTAGWCISDARDEGAALSAPALRDALAGTDVYRAGARRARRASARTICSTGSSMRTLSLYLADDILVKVDRMSMATSLETRAPFLDGDVMELAFSMPGHLKIRNGERKWILKQAMRGVLPDRILNRARRKASASR